MAYENPVLTKSYTASADYSTTGQWRFVEFASGTSVQTVNAITDVALGVMQNAPVLNGTAVVMHLGITKVYSAAAIALGAKVAPSANGRAQTAVSTQHVAGIALEAATAGDQLIPILLCIGGAPLP